MWHLCFAPNQAACDTKLSLQGVEADPKKQRTKRALPKWPHTMESQQRDEASRSSLSCLQR